MLRLVTRRMGAARPQTLELVPTSDRRTPRLAKPLAATINDIGARSGPSFHRAKVDDSARRWTWSQQHLGRLCARRLLKGTAAEAVIGSASQSGSTVDGVLTLGILCWTTAASTATGGDTLAGSSDSSGRSLANDGWSAWPG